MQKRYLVMLLMLVPLLVACQQNIPAASSGEVKEFTTMLMGYRYSPSEITVQEGDTVKLTVMNHDSVRHGISLPEYGVQDAINPRETKTLTFVATQKGSPTTFCSTDHGEKLVVNVR